MAALFLNCEGGEGRSGVGGHRWRPRWWDTGSDPVTLPTALGVWLQSWGGGVLHANLKRGPRYTSDTLTSTAGGGCPAAWTGFISASEIKVVRIKSLKFANSPQIKLSPTDIDLEGADWGKTHQCVWAQALQSPHTQPQIQVTSHRRGLSSAKPNTSTMFAQKQKRKHGRQTGSARF